MITPVYLITLGLLAAITSSALPVPNFNVGTSSPSGSAPVNKIKCFDFNFDIFNAPIVAKPKDQDTGVDNGLLASLQLAAGGTGNAISNGVAKRAFNFDIFNAPVKAEPKDQDVGDSGILAAIQLAAAEAASRLGANEKREFNFSSFLVGNTATTPSVSSSSIFTRFFNWSGFNPGNPTPPTPRAVDVRVAPSFEEGSDNTRLRDPTPPPEAAHLPVAFP